jgi:phosphate transport system substrate-binding protein
MSPRVILIVLVVLAVVALAAMSFSGRDKGGQTVMVLGSTSIHPFAEVLSQDFDKRQSAVYVEVQGGGSTAGLQAVVNHVAEIGMCSRGLNEQEKGAYLPIEIARDGLAIVVHAGNPLDGLTTEQIADVFAGKITNWRELGGPDKEIHVITREEGSGTREAFQKLVMGKDRRIFRRAVTQESNGAVHELVLHDPAAVGYMSLGLAKELKLLKVDGVEPTRQNVMNKSYALVRPFLFVVRRGEPVSDSARQFIDFVLSESSQRMLEREGLVAADKPAATSTPLP